MKDLELSTVEVYSMFIEFYMHNSNKYDSFGIVNDTIFIKHNEHFVQYCDGEISYIGEYEEDITNPSKSDITRFLKRLSYA